MSFCPRCGGATTPGLSFCAACGDHLPAIPVASASTGSPPVEGRGPVGKRVHPLFVGVMAILLSGVYPLWFWWRTSREMDAYSGSESRGIVAMGVAIVAASLAVSLAIGASVSGEMDLPTVFQTEGWDVAAERFAAGVAAHPWTPWQVGTGVLGAAVLLVGLWRLWHALRAEEQRRHHPAPWNPAVALVILAGGAFLPLAAYVVPAAGLLVLDLLSLGFAVATVLVLFQMQARLNKLWEPASGP